MGVFHPLVWLWSFFLWLLIGALAIWACEAGAQTYTHQSDPAQFDGSFLLPAVELDLAGNPIAITHDKWQFHTGMQPAGHRGLVSNGFTFGPGMENYIPPLCDGTLWGHSDDWSHGHGGVNDCSGPCQPIEVRFAKCDTQTGGTLQFRDGHVYWQPSNMTNPNLAPMLYGITQFGPSTGLNDGASSQHGGPILREILVENSGGRVMVWGANASSDPSTARLRVTGWDWDGRVHPLLDVDIPDWPMTNPVLAATWPAGVSLQWIVVDGTVDVGKWFMGDLQLNAVDPVCTLTADINGDGIVGGPDFAILVSEWGRSCP